MHSCTAPICPQIQLKLAFRSLLGNLLRNFPSRAMNTLKEPRRVSNISFNPFYFRHL